jgi:hypothetical protein
MTPPGGGDGSVVNVAVALFAKLDLGVFVVDPNGYTMTVGVPPEQLDPAILEETLRTSLATEISPRVTGRATGVDC